MITYIGGILRLIEIICYSLNGNHLSANYTTVVATLRSVEIVLFIAAQSPGIEI